MRAPKSLRARAVDALSRREHSRVELGVKLAAHAESAGQIETLLDSLEKEGLLSNERFAESLAHRREERFGSRRILLEMEQHGLAREIVEGRRDELEATEFARCRAVWEKKFGALPAHFTEMARQTRFLAARGFAGDCIRRVLKGENEDSG